MGKELIDNQQKGRPFTIHYIEPGVVGYEHLGVVMVDKEALDRMANSFVGKPIFNKRHRDATDNDFSAGRADGIVTRCYWDGEKGKYAVDTLIWDGDTITDILENGYLPSCSYDADFKGVKGRHNNVPYQDEVANGTYTHLAIVPNPRYERVSIIANQGGQNMKLMFWKKDQKLEDKPSEVELANSVVEIEAGKEIKVEDLIAGYTADQNRKAEELANSKAKMSDEDHVDIGGKKILVKDLKVGYLANLKNSAQTAEQDHQGGKHKDKALDACTTCASELQNALVEKTRKDKEIADEKVAEAKRVEDLRNAQHRGQDPVMPEPPQDRSARLQAGAERYGEIKN